MTEDAVIEKPTLTRENIAGLFHKWADAQLDGDLHEARLRHGLAIKVREADSPGNLRVETSWVSALQDYHLAVRMVLDAGWIMDEVGLPLSGLPEHNPYPEFFTINEGMGFGPSATLVKEGKGVTHTLRIWHHREEGEEDTVAMELDGEGIASSLEELEEWLGLDELPALPQGEDRQVLIRTQHARAA